MPFARPCAAFFFAVLALGVFAPAASAAKPLPGPKGLKAFLLRVDESEAIYNRTFPRTPAFAWRAVPRAKRYEFELSTSKTFSEGAVVWSSATAKVDVPTPAISPGVSLPWITGNPYSLYARVRAIAANGKDGVWSAPFGFNMRWRNKPAPLNPQSPGLIRWTPIEGATMYEVWLYGARETFFTTTNVADEREFYTLHTGAQWTGSVTWRVRAVRKLYGDIPNGLPATTVGPWSSQYVNFNPPFATGELAQVGTVSDIVSTAAAPQAHELTPGFTFTGNYRSWGSPWFLDTTTELYHVYVFTDSECVNRVYTSAIVGSPAYAPRFEHTLALPNSAGSVPAARSEMAKYGEEGTVKMLDGQVVKAADAGGLGAGKIDLWDSFWPEGGYYWTVVPIYMNTTTGDGIEYRDIQLPEDVCRAGGSVRFGKIGKPVVLADNNAPYISGLSPDGQARRRQEGLAIVLRPPARRLGAGLRRPRVRGAVEPNAEPVAPRGHAADDAGHRRRAARQGRALVLQGSRPQPVAPQEAGDDVVEARLAPRREAALPHRQALAARPPPRRSRRGSARRARLRADRSSCRSPRAGLGRPCRPRPPTRSDRTSSCTSSTGRPSRDRSQPTSSSASAGDPPVMRSSPASAIPARAPRGHARQGRVHRHAMSETAVCSKSGPSSRYATGRVLPLTRIDDEPVADPDHLLELRRAERELSAPAEEDGQIGDQERRDDAGRRLHAPAPQRELDHLGRDVAPSPFLGEGEHRDPRVDPVDRRRLGKQEDPPRGVALPEPCEGVDRGLTPFGGHPGEMGHDTGSKVRPLRLPSRRIAQLPERAFHVGRSDVLAGPILGLNRWRAQCLSHSRPSRRISSLAAAGPQVPAA